MKFSAVLKLGAAALATGALLLPSVGPAQAAPYPPAVSVVYASPYLSGGYVPVSVVGSDLVAGIKVRASYAKRSTTANLDVHSSGTVATAMVKVGNVLPRDAGRYNVSFKLEGAALGGAKPATSQTYTVGKATSIKSFSVKRKSYGLSISGKTAKKTPVKITVKIGSKTYTKTVKSSRSGSFSYKFKKKTSRGTYTVTAQVAKNTKYFSSPVTKTYKRS